MIERDPLSTCNDPCTALSSSGLELVRSISQTRAGRIVRIVDTIKSTDGQPHTFAIGYDEYSQNTSSNGLRFPGASGYTVYPSASTTVAGPSTATATVNEISNTTQPPSLNNPVGALTTSPAPDDYRVTYAGGFVMRFSGSIPAGGSKTIKQSFAIGESDAEVATYRDENIQAFNPAPPTPPKPAPSAALTLAGEPHTGVITVYAPTSCKSTGGASCAGTLALKAATKSGLIDAGTAAFKTAGGSRTFAARLNTAARALLRKKSRLVVGAYLRQGNRLVAHRRLVMVFNHVTLAGKPTVDGTTASTPLACASATAVKCAGHVTLSTVSRVDGKPKRVTVGVKAYKFADGKKLTVETSLNARGRALLKKHGSLAVRVSVVRGASTVIAKRAVTFTAP